MSTNEPTGDGSAAGGSGNPDQGRAAGNGPSYSGYREGAYGEPVPDQTWSAQQGGSGQPDEQPGRQPYGQQPYEQQPYPQPYSQQQYPPPYGGPPGSPPYGAPPPGSWGPAPQSTNGMAIASLVLGILWIYWVGSVLALIFGYVARRQIRERGEGGEGMAIAGIVLGWIGVAALVVFVVILIVAGISSSGYN